MTSTNLSRRATLLAAAGTLAAPALVGRAAAQATAEPMTQLPPAIAPYRITSYNVCYTKLLRDRIDTFPDEAEEPVVMEIINQDPTISVAVFGDVSEKRMRQVAEKIRDDLLVAKMAPDKGSGVIQDIIAVITSYSIHYTKLYEVWFFFLPYVSSVIWPGPLR